MKNSERYWIEFRFRGLKITETVLKQLLKHLNFFFCTKTNGHFLEEFYRLGKPQWLVFFDTFCMAINGTVAFLDLLACYHAQRVFSVAACELHFHQFKFTCISRYMVIIGKLLAD